MPWMTPVVVNYDWNTMARNYLSHFSTHTFTDTQWKWSTPEQEACGIYYAITKWNFYLQGSDTIMHIYPQTSKLMVTGIGHIQYNLWMDMLVFGNKAADCLSWLIEIPVNDAAAASILINSVTASPPDRPTTCTCSKTKASMEAIPPDTTKVKAPPLFTGDHKDALLQMQRTDPFWKHIF